MFQNILQKHELVLSKSSKKIKTFNIKSEKLQAKHSNHNQNITIKQLFKKNIKSFL